MTLPFISMLKQSCRKIGVLLYPRSFSLLRHFLLTFSVLPSLTRKHTYKSLAILSETQIFELLHLKVWTRGLRSKLWSVRGPAVSPATIRSGLEQHEGSWQRPLHILQHVFLRQNFLPALSLPRLSVHPKMYSSVHRVVMECAKVLSWWVSAMMVCGRYIRSPARQKYNSRLLVLRIKQLLQSFQHKYTKGHCRIF